MDDIGSLVGVISGVISIFTFLTGVNSVRFMRAEARADSGQGPRWAGPRVFVRSRVWIVVVFLIFLASMAVTLAEGLAGSDTSGARFLLLLLAGSGLIIFVLRLSRSYSVLSYGLFSIVALTAAGYVIGSVSVGEEAEDAAFGLFIGICVAGMAWLFRPADQAPPYSAPVAERRQGEGVVSGDVERKILQFAAQEAGEVTVTNVALGTDLSLEDARTCLESLHQRDFCERKRTEQGATIYRFPDLVR